MNLKYAIFDMDGTLLDSMKYWRNAVYECCSKIIPETEIIMLKDTLSYMTSNKSLEYMKNNFGSPLNDLNMQDILEKVSSHYDNGVPLKVGMGSLLRGLKSKGVRMCVISATPTKYVIKALKNSGIFGYFDFILTVDDFKEGKKNPDIFLEAAKRFNTSPESIALYEDSLYSIKTAKNTGLYVIGVDDVYQKDDKPEIIEICDEYMEA